jgi:aspartyl-tRNA(Asn)/glutamyl-tRNA(Gln) amidotransferase subunit C
MRSAIINCMTTTSVTQDDVLHLAQLSSLQLNDDEVIALQAELSTILEYVTQLGELDTDGVEPTYQVTDLENVWRDDVIEDVSVGRSELLAIAPEKQENQIKVPKVL